MSSAATPNSGDYYGIYTGPWINWSQGSLLGGTITLNRRDGGFLISLIALFVTWTGTSFWRISCYLLHQYYSTEAPRDGVHHQRQVILRNSANGISGLWALGQIAWVWRRQASYSRLLPLLVFIPISLSCFAIAGIFSSKIATSTASQVLVSSPSCGGFNADLELNQTLLQTIYAPFVQKQILDAANYAQRCYSGASSPQECLRYVQGHIPWSTNRNSSCPFGRLCKNELGNLELDSGFIDSNEHLGLNAPPEHRLKVRHLLRCAPLVTDDYASPEMSPSSENGEERNIKYYYGHKFPESDPTRDFTYQYFNSSYQRFIDQNGTSASQDYTLGVVEAMLKDGQVKNVSMFIPIPDLRQLEGDITLLFLSANFVSFTKMTNDPWYSAHLKFGTIKRLTKEGVEDMYRADEPASVLGCVSQYQICDTSLPADRRCSALGSRSDAFNHAARLQTSQEGDRRLQWFQYPVAFTLGRCVDSLRASALTSRYALQDGLQGPLPDNQWQLDVEYWFQVWLSYLQARFMLSATGPSDPELRRWVQPPETKVEKQLCQNQKITTTAYTNFNTFGVCLIFAIGSLIIIISYTIEPLARWVQRRRRLDNYSHLEWCANEVLQLQRLAHEELGAGTWHDGAAPIPFTDAGERLATLDVADPKHPKLKAPPKRFDELLAREKSGEDADNGGESGPSSAGDGVDRSTLDASAEPGPSRCGNDSSHRESRTL